MQPVLPTLGVCVSFKFQKVGEIVVAGFPTYLEFSN